MQSVEKQAYDRGDIFSPDGRLYQVEYAREAVSRGSPVVGVTGADGVALAAAITRRSPLQTADSVEKLRTVDHHLALGAAGHAADARRLTSYARERAQGERLRYGTRLDAETLASAIADQVQEATQQSGTRPFGTALLVCGPDADGVPTLHEVDPSGTPSAWRAAAVGAGREAAVDVLEAGYDDDLSVDDALSLSFDALAAATDDPSPESVRALTVTDDSVETVDDATVADAFQD